MIEDYQNERVDIPPTETIITKEVVVYKDKYMGAVFWNMDPEDTKIGTSIYSNTKFRGIICLKDFISPITGINHHLNVIRLIICDKIVLERNSANEFYMYWGVNKSFMFHYFSHEYNKFTGLVANDKDGKYDASYTVQACTNYSSNEEYIGLKYNFILGDNNQNEVLYIPPQEIYYVCTDGPSGLDVDTQVGGTKILTQEEVNEYIKQEDLYFNRT